MSRGLSEYEINFMFGYIDQKTMANAVSDGHVEVSRMIHRVQQMNGLWGGYDGLLTFFRLYEENPALGQRFLKDYGEINQKPNHDKSVHIYDFDEDYTEEEWRFAVRLCANDEGE